jgi:CheY-like chemotaxis protein
MQAHNSYLYVEDDALSREVLETLLVEVMGAKHLTVFADSENFMERLRAVDPPPDVIFLDILVQPHDGYALLRTVRNDPAFASVKVLAVTASVMAKEIEQLKAEGFNGALAKPLDMLTFPDLIRRLEMGETIWQVD